MGPKCSSPLQDFPGFCSLGLWDSNQPVADQGAAMSHRVGGSRNTSALSWVFLSPMVGNADLGPKDSVWELN